MSSTDKQLAGVIGFFESPASLMTATEKVRDARYQGFDAFTPFPVHGLETAQGLKRSALPYVTFVAGITGLSLAFLFQYWTSAVDWPINVGGKPMNSWPAFVPVMFELTVLLAGLFTVGALFAVLRLPNTSKKAFDPSLTRDRFALVIDAPEVKPVSEDDEEVAPKAVSTSHKAFSESEAADFLKKLGAKDVRSVYNEGWF